MSNPTTPFSWQMPTNTDLVTDLPADFAVFGQAVATSMADLLGGTTGQVLSKTTNADMDFTWVAANPGDITGVTAGTGISGGGTSGTVTVTNDMATTITTAGDLIKGTGSGTYARLGIGSTGQILTVSAGAPAWATPAAGGGMTLINSGGTTLTSTITTIGSIPNTYKDLVLIIRGFKPTTIDTTFMLQLNGTTSSSYFTLATNTTSPTGQTFSGTEFRNATGMSNDADCQYNLMRVLIPDYANTTTYKMIDSLEVNKYAYAGATANWGQSRFMGTFSSASAISSIGITLNGVGWTSGTAYVYGVN